MIYLDSSATSFPKPWEVLKAMQEAMESCANPGRGGYPAAMAGAEAVYRCREEAGKLFSCAPEQVAMTKNCTEGLNIAIRTLWQPGDRVVITGFEHNAVVRPLHALGAEIVVAGRRLFDWEDSLREFEKALDRGAEGAVFTQVSNVFGYILPTVQIAKMCRSRGLPFVIDAAQSAGAMEVDFGALGADFLAAPGHKGLLGPMGTGLLLCKDSARPLVCGGTGSQSSSREMPDFLPDALEAGTLNVPGIAGLAAGIRLIRELGPEKIGKKEREAAQLCARGLESLGMRVFHGEHQGGTLSFLAGEEGGETLEKYGICVRTGLHCAPLAHESAGTAETGTIRASFGPQSEPEDGAALVRAASKLTPFRR